VVVLHPSSFRLACPAERSAAPEPAGLKARPVAPGAFVDDQRRHSPVECNETAALLRPAYRLRGLYI
jgi:hypothetical protein